MTLLAASINQHQTFLADGHSDYGYSPPGELMATNEVSWVDFQTAKLTLSWWHLGQQGIAGLPVTSCHQLHSKWIFWTFFQHISQEFLGLGQWFQFKDLPQRRGRSSATAANAYSFCSKTLPNVTLW